MRVRDGFMLREIAGSWIVVPIGERVVEFNGLICLSESGAFLWKSLESGVENEEELVKALTKEYDVDEETAMSDTREFLATIIKSGLVETEYEMGTA
jgi:hypothetical protein